MAVVEKRSFENVRPKLIIALDGDSPENIAVQFFISESFRAELCVGVCLFVLHGIRCQYVPLQIS